MSTADAWMDGKSHSERPREPIGVVLSQIILALGMSLALAVIAMAVIWSSSPPSANGAGAPGYRASWRPIHHFRAVAPRANLSSVADADPSPRRQSPPSA
jgi:hypothetical protein